MTVFLVINPKHVAIGAFDTFDNAYCSLVLTFSTAGRVRRIDGSDSIDDAMWEVYETPNGEFTIMEMVVKDRVDHL